MKNYWKKKSIPLFAITLLMLPQIARADVSKGNSELTLNTSFFHQNDSDTGNISVDASYGYFLSDMFEIGLRQGLLSNLVDNGSDTFIATTSPFFRLNFNSDENQQLVPYIGVFTGIVWNDEDVTGTLGPEAGLRVFLSEQAFLSMQYRYEWFFDDLDLDNFSDDVDTISDNSSDGNHIASVGIGYAW